MLLSTLVVVTASLTASCVWAAGHPLPCHGIHCQTRHPPCAAIQGELLWGLLTNCLHDSTSFTWLCLCSRILLLSMWHSHEQQCIMWLCMCSIDVASSRLQVVGRQCCMCFRRRMFQDLQSDLTTCSCPSCCHASALEVLETTTRRPQCCWAEKLR